MINKYAEIQDRIILYNACKGILRIKTAHYPTEKRAFGPVGAAVGGTALGIGGYYGGRALSRKLGLEDNDWRAKALRYGGAGLGAVGGAVGGWFAGPAISALATKIGGGAAAAGATVNAARVASAASKASKLANIGSKALKAVDTVSNISNAADAVSSLAK